MEEGAMDGIHVVVGVRGRGVSSRVWSFNIESIGLARLRESD